jgi:hypothetical protein
VPPSTPEPSEDECGSIGEAAERLQILERGLVKPKRLQKAEDFIQTAGEEKIAPLGQSSHEQAEDGDIAHLLLEVRLEHRELLEIGQERRAEPH